MKRALITGIAGQDGSYMAELLLSKKYKVYGLSRDNTDLTFVPKGVNILYGDLVDETSLQSAMIISKPDEVYNFGGITDLKTAYGDPELTMKINYESVGILLREALNINPKVHFLQASSSEVFLPSAQSLYEKSSRDWDTKNPYAKAKMLADRDYIEHARQAGAYACSVILFNHESPRRRKSVTTKIVRTLFNIKKGIEEVLVLGNIDMQRDWGFAGEYCEAMWSMLQIDTATDLVIASGIAHSVREFIDITAHQLDMHIMWQGEGVNMNGLDEKGEVIVKVSSEFYRSTDVYPKIGNISKAQNILEWKPKVDLQALVALIVRSVQNEKL